MKNLIISIKLTLVCLVLFTVIYPLFVLGIAKLASNKGEGELVSANYKSYYSNIAQNFTESKYFSSRPSATNYNGSGSGGSNKGTSNPDYLAVINARIDTFLIQNPSIEKHQVPADLVTASGSGLDPHLSYASALVQTERIAKARNISKETVLQIIDNNREQALFGLFGPEKINVLKLNLALDETLKNNN